MGRGSEIGRVWIWWRWRREIWMGIGGGSGGGGRLLASGKPWWWRESIRVWWR
ncbi:hypothetical protein Hanom_Chr08g00692221 [Helianthus anomalus]